ncbi:MAG: hypothetical protein KDC09_13630 [Bacteroidales bacterium]|nr:hypothetical protein [Bacteroidales bacterium]
MKTKNIYFAVLSLAFFTLIHTSTLFAQRGPGYGRPGMEEQRDKIEAHKIAFITEKVDLTPAEAEKFWPLYNDNRDKVEAERKAFREKYRLEGMDPDSMSDEEAIERLNAQLEHEQKMLDMQFAFNEELQKVLPPQKILKLIKAEQDFKLELMRRFAGPEAGPRGGR